MVLCCANPSQLRKSSVSTHFRIDSSAATSKFGTIPERPGGNDEHDSVNVSKRHAVRPEVQYSLKTSIPCNISFILTNLLVLSHYGKQLTFYLC